MVGHGLELEIVGQGIEEVEVVDVEHGVVEEEFVKGKTVQEVLD